MTRQMAGDYAKYGVRVNAPCPGWVDTPFNEPFIDQMGGREAIEAYIRERVARPLGERRRDRRVDLFLVSTFLLHDGTVLVWTGARRWSDR